MITCTISQLKGTVILGFRGRVNTFGMRELFNRYVFGSNEFLPFVFKAACPIFITSIGTPVAQT